MRKSILLIVSVLALMLPLRAQYSDMYYHRVGDTIEMRSEIGYYAWWGFERYYANNLPLRIEPREPQMYDGSSQAAYGHDSLVVVQRYYTPTP